MNITLSERPGVYSGYSASGIVTASSSNGEVALIMTTEAITEPKRYVTTAAARTDFGADAPEYKCVEAALANGARACWVSPVLPITASDGLPQISTKSYTNAARALRDTDAYAYFTDCPDVTAWKAIRDEAVTASNERLERICVFAAEHDLDTLTAFAEMVANERCVIVGPVPKDETGANIRCSYVAAAVAAAIVSLPDPAVPLGGAVLAGLYGSGGILEDAEVDTLVTGGVTPIECVAGRIEVVRGITTRIKTGGVEDNTWRELSTILIADDVMKTLRSTLKARFTRAKNLPSTREAVANQTTLILESKKSAGIIADYGAVSATASDTDPSRCDVSFEFAVAYGMNRIVIAAHILV